MRQNTTRGFCQAIGKASFILLLEGATDMKCQFHFQTRAVM